MKAKTKKIAIGATAMTLVAGMAIGGTLSYLTKQTEKRANNFTFASVGLDARLTEPDWDGVKDYEYDDDGNIIPVYDYIDNPDYDPDKPVDPKDNPDKLPVYCYDENDNPITDKSKIDDFNDVEKNRKKKDKDGNPIEYGDEAAQLMVPGQSALKNPVITNSGSLSDEWVAAKITFVYSDESKYAGETLSPTDMSAVLAAIDIDYNDTDWDNVSTTTDGTSMVFYYKSILKKDSDPDDVGTYGDTTTPIFTTVTVKPDAENDQIKALEDMKGFAIYIEGFGIQDTVMEKYSQETLNKFVTFASDSDTAAKAVAKPGIISAKKASTPAPEITPTPEDTPTPDETPDQAE